MAEVNAIIHQQHYKTHISTATNNLTADEPIADGGTDEGFSPTELLAASLAACTSITLRMYADRKGYLLEQIDVNVTVNKDATKNVTNIGRRIHFTGNLKEEEKKRLVEIANNCPIHKILSNQISITTELI